MKAVIYKLVSPSGNFYLGSTKRKLSERVRQHFGALRRGDHVNYILQRVWNKYGKLEVVCVEEFEYTNPQEVIDREQYWIDSLKPSYNICTKAFGPPEATVQSRENMRQAHLGKTIPKHVVEMLRSIHTGKVRSSEHRRKTMENHGRARLVLNLETGIYYSSSLQAAIAHNIKPATLHKRLRVHGSRSGFSFV